MLMLWQYVLTFLTSLGSKYMNTKNPRTRPIGIPIPKPKIPKKLSRNPIFFDHQKIKRRFCFIGHQESCPTFTILHQKGYVKSRTRQQEKSFFWIVRIIETRKFSQLASADGSYAVLELTNARIGSLILTISGQWNVATFSIWIHCK